MKAELKERTNGEWDYRLVADNGEILAVSEGYNSKGNAKRAVESLLEQIKNDDISIVD